MNLRNYIDTFKYRTFQTIEIKVRTGKILSLHALSLQSEFTVLTFSPSSFSVHLCVCFLSAQELIHKKQQKSDAGKQAKPRIIICFKPKADNFLLIHKILSTFI